MPPTFAQAVGVVAAASEHVPLSAHFVCVFRVASEQEPAAVGEWTTH